MRYRIGNWMAAALIATLSAAGTAQVTGGTTLHALLSSAFSAAGAGEASGAADGQGSVSAPYTQVDGQGSGQAQGSAEGYGEITDGPSGINGEGAGQALGSAEGYGEITDGPSGINGGGDFMQSTWGSASGDMVFEDADSVDASGAADSVPDASLDGAGDVGTPDGVDGQATLNGSDDSTAGDDEGNSTSTAVQDDDSNDGTVDSPDQGSQPVESSPRHRHHVGVHANVDDGISANIDADLEIEGGISSKLSALLGL